MPSRYKRRPGSRRYQDYTNDQLEECLNMIRSKQLTQRAAEEQYGIPRSTIKNKLKKKHPNKPGHPTTFTDDEENSFVAHIMALSEYGFPITDTDLKFIIKDYLMSQGREVRKFKNNIPGQEWVRSFLHRHQDLSRRFANNIKKVRAQVSEQTITEFIDNIATELENVPAENIYNYDETNLTDDPGKKKVICRRGCKYPENIVNSSKLSYSVMFCGSASGESIPPYVIYKADHLWTTWTENGPPGARYNRTKSGWMDAATFQDWFLHHLLPILKQKEGRKVVIGDNLSSHINQKVLEECEKHNIGFVCLPANSTHILQPLDVAYFRPLKLKWRQTLLNWKHSQTGRNMSTTPKDQFPGLLKSALDSMTATRENIIAGFKKTGIMPVNKNEPLSRLPKQDRIVNFDLITGSFMHKLQQSRLDSTETKTSKKKKLNVPAGCSISAADIANASSSSDVVPSQVSKKKVTVKRVSRPPKRKLRHDSTTSCSSNIMSDVSSTEDLPDDILNGSFDDQETLTPKYQMKPNVDKQTESNFDKEPESKVDKELESNDDAQTESNIINNTVFNQQQECTPSTSKTVIVIDEESEDHKTSLKDTVAIDNHVLVRWGDKIYPGQIISMCEEGVMVSVMKKGVKFWRWPLIRDEQLYCWENVIQKINVPKLMKKGYFCVPEIDLC